MPGNGRKMRPVSHVFLQPMEKMAHKKSPSRQKNRMGT